jgi:hypothetical protein
VLSPWTGPIMRTFRVRGGVWARRLATPLDGTLTVHLTRLAEVTLIDDHGQAMRPTGRRGATQTYRVCGERSVAIRVTAPDKVGRRVDLGVVTPRGGGRTQAHWNPRAVR